MILLLGEEEEVGPNGRGNVIKLLVQTMAIIPILTRMLSPRGGSYVTPNTPCNADRGHFQ